MFVIPGAPAGFILGFCTKSGAEPGVLMHAGAGRAIRLPLPHANQHEAQPTLLPPSAFFLCFVWLLGTLCSRTNALPSVVFSFSSYWWGETGNPPPCSYATCPSGSVISAGFALFQDGCPVVSGYASRLPCWFQATNAMTSLLNVLIFFFF